MAASDPRKDRCPFAVDGILANRGLKRLTSWNGTLTPEAA
jgi:hypothetical protein